MAHLSRVNGCAEGSSPTQLADKAVQPHVKSFAPAVGNSWTAALRSMTTVE
jgi:hypothetical protein